MLEKYHNIFIVGIKGVAMTNLAKILTQMGKKVTGSDTAESFITEGALVDSKIIVLPSFSGMLLPDDTDLVIYAAAHEGDQNPQVKEAIERGVDVKHQIEIIGEVMKMFETSIAVTGCHGKTTTSSMLAHALQNLNQKPSYIVGVSEFNNQIGGKFDGKKYFVLEADEYGMNPPHDKTPKFFFINPDIALVTNIDFDHPDVYHNLEDTKVAFHKFMKKVVDKSDKSKLFLCADDENLMEVAAKLPRNKIITYGYSPDADYIIKDSKVVGTETEFTVKKKVDSSLQSYRIGLFGEKNIANAAGVVAVLLDQGFAPQDIAKAIQPFTGAKRRFELITNHEQIYLFDDYAHHPNEVKATVQAAKTRFPDSKLIILFQPHTYSRTRELKNEFIDALKQSDVSIILPIFASAREKEDAAISSKQMVEEAQKMGVKNIYALESLSDIEDMLRQHMTKNCVIFTMGAGDVYKLAQRIVPLMHQIDIF